MTPGTRDWAGRRSERHALTSATSRCVIPIGRELVGGLTKRPAV